MNHSASHAQRGMAVLAMVLVLLLATTLAGLYAQRALVVAVRSGANEARAAIAFEQAEAGLAWAVEALNDPLDRAAAPFCTAQPGSLQRFRDRALPWRARCARGPGDAGWDCHCGIDAGTATSDMRSGFEVDLRPVPGHEDRVELVSSGCTAMSDCTAPDAVMQARARHRMVVQAVPLLSLVPTAAAAAAGDLRLQGTLGVSNVDAAGHGITAMAAGRIAADRHVGFEGRAGMPPSATRREASPTMAAWTGAPDELVRAVFGLRLGDVRRDPLTREIAPSDCADAQACGLALAQQVESGVTQIVVPGRIRLDRSMRPDGRFGSADRPLVILGSGDVELGDGVVVHGLWIGLRDLRMTLGRATLRGAVLSAGRLDMTGDGATLSHVRIAPKGRYVALPGTWIDHGSDDVGSDAP